MSECVSETEHISRVTLCELVQHTSLRARARAKRTDLHHVTCTVIESSALFKQASKQASKQALFPPRPYRAPVENATFEAMSLRTTGYGQQNMPRAGARGRGLYVSKQPLCNICPCGPWDAHTPGLLGAAEVRARWPLPTLSKFLVCVHVSGPGML